MSNNQIRGSANKENVWKHFHLNDKELPLHQVNQLVFASMDSQQAIETMKKLCLLTQSDENKRIGLEFLYAHGFLKELDLLIERNFASTVSTNHRWAELYQILSERRKTKNVAYDFTKTQAYLAKIESLSLEEEELKCLSDFLHLYAYFELKDYNKLGKYADRLFTRIFHLEDPLLKELFSIRLDEVQVIYHWKRNEMIIARKFGYRILNTTGSLRKKIDIHNMMALGYLYDSYEQAMHHIDSALQIANQIDFIPAIQGINNFTLPFISAHHGITEGLSSTDNAEQAHLALAKGDIETCVQILSDMKSLTPFQQYYLGKALGDQGLLEESYNRFIKERSDYFFAKLPLHELQKLKITH